LDAGQDCSNVVRRTPAVLEDVQTELSVVVDVWMEHAREELDSRWPVRILLVKGEHEPEGAVFERCIGFFVVETYMFQHTSLEDTQFYWKSNSPGPKMTAFQTRRLSGHGAPETPAGGSDESLLKSRTCPHGSTRPGKMRVKKWECQLQTSKTSEDFPGTRRRRATVVWRLSQLQFQCCSHENRAIPWGRMQTGVAGATERRRKVREETKSQVATASTATELLIVDYNYIIAVIAYVEDKGRQRIDTLQKWDSYIKTRYRKMRRKQIQRPKTTSPPHRSWLWPPLPLPLF
jgi:hypothetical protein